MVFAVGIEETQGVASTELVLIDKNFIFKVYEVF